MTFDEELAKMVEGFARGEVAARMRAGAALVELARSSFQPALELREHGRPIAIVRSTEDRPVALLVSFEDLTWQG